MAELTYDITIKQSGQEAIAAATSPMSSWTFTRMVSQQATLVQANTYGLELVGVTPEILLPPTGVPFSDLAFQPLPGFYAVGTDGAGWAGGVNVY